MEATIALSSHIYIVDDDKSFGKSLKRLLCADGFSVDYFRSAWSFLNSVPPGQHGYAIVDIQMPECDGFSLIDKMNALHYDLHIILVTGCVQNNATEMALKKGAIGLLQKPFSEESLLALFDKADFAGSPS